MSKALLTLWLRPGDTIEAALTNARGWQAPLLAILSGISIGIVVLGPLGYAADITRTDSLAYFGLFGLPAGLINLYLFSFGLRCTAKLFGGTASQRAITLATAWAGIPFIVGLALMLVLTWTLGDRARIALGALSLILSIWSWVTLVAMVRRLERFGTGKALVTFLIALALFTLAPAYATRTYLAQSFSVGSNSMEPTLAKGQIFLVTKGLLLGHPARGELVVFRLATSDHADYVKRLIGLPGDRIRITHRVLYVNDQPIPREQLDGSGTRYRETLDGRSFEVMNSVGPETQVDNTGEFVVPDGQCFMLGDSRDNSLDSRFSGQFGYIPLANVIGKVALILYSSSDRKRLDWSRIGSHPV